MISPSYLDRQLLGVRQDGVHPFHPKPTCSCSPPAPQVLQRLLQPLLPGPRLPQSQVSHPHLSASPGQHPPGTPVSSQCPSGPPQPAGPAQPHLWVPSPSSPLLSPRSLCCRHASLLAVNGPRQAHSPLRQPQRETQSPLSPLETLTPEPQKGPSVCQGKQEELGLQTRAPGGVLPLADHTGHPPVDVQLQAVRDPLSLSPNLIHTCAHPCKGPWRLPWYHWTRAEDLSLKH